MPDIRFAMQQSSHGKHSRPDDAKQHPTRSRGLESGLRDGGDESATRFERATERWPVVVRRSERFRGGLSLRQSSAADRQLVIYYVDRVRRNGLRIRLDDVRLGS